ncbi:hypothetical protein A9R00_07920 [Oleispira antarctica]|uniref:Uncharacterized protein n=1 Tax=Oleispira antarctica TaxID=188908 RepID=A0A1Y5HYA6_OLEAN|nr:hypothetical protein A9R00_07920 [Oleispira antarctica]
MLWLVIILVILIFTSLVLALKFLVFNNQTAKDSMDKLHKERKNDKKVVGLLTLRVIFSIILLLLCYLYLSSL